MLANLKNQPYLTQQFGCSYSSTNHKSHLIGKKYSRQPQNCEENVHHWEEENSSLKKELREVKDLLVELISNEQNRGSMEEKSLEQLLQDLLKVILSITEQNSHIRKMNFILNEQLQKWITQYNSPLSSLAVSSDHTDGISNSSFKNLVQFDPLLKEIESSQLTSKHSRFKQIASTRNSQESTKTKTKYKPNVLFELAKEVKSIKEVPTDQHLSQKNQSQENISGNSLKQLRALKGKLSHRVNRASIDEFYLKQNLWGAEKGNVCSGMMTIQSFTQNTPASSESIIDKFDELKENVTYLSVLEHEKAIKHFDKKLKSQEFHCIPK